MRTRCRFIGLGRTYEGEISASFAIDEECVNELEKLEEMELVMELDTYRRKRSLNANNYFWKLCTEIAQRLGSDKDTIYLMKLKDVGAFEILDIPLAEVEKIRPFFRLVEIDHEYIADTYSADGQLIDSIKMASLHCFKGSHEYDSKQMSVLINSTVNDAQELGISTWTAEEINYYCSIWKARKE